MLRRPAAEIDRTLLQVIVIGVAGLGLTGGMTLAGFPFWDAFRVFSGLTSSLMIFRLIIGLGRVRRWCEAAEIRHPDYQRVRGRVALGSGELEFFYTPLSDDSDEPSPDGVRVYVRTADHDKIIRR